MSHRDSPNKERSVVSGHSAKCSFSSACATAFISILQKKK